MEVYDDNDDDDGVVDVELSRGGRPEVTSLRLRGILLATADLPKSIIMFDSRQQNVTPSQDVLCGIYF